jgi:cell division septal protein FtsQ
VKSKSVLKKQAVKKKRKKNVSMIWRIFYFFGSLFVKFSFLAIGLILVSLLFLYIYQYLVTSPHIKLERVIITGVDKHLKSELLKISQLRFDLSLLAIDIEELKPRLETHPWIRSVQIEKRFPHTLVIRAEKEKPWALVALENISYMNRWGRIFKELDQSDGVDYPVITGIFMSSKDKETQLQLAAQILRILESERDPWSLKELSEIHINKYGNVSLYFISVPAVIKLKGSELDSKKDDLKRIFDHLNKSDLIHTVKGIDLHYKDGALVSFKPG